MTGFYATDSKYSEDPTICPNCKSDSKNSAPTELRQTWERMENSVHMIAPSDQRNKCNAFCVSGSWTKNVANDENKGGIVTHLIYKKCKNAPATKGMLNPGLKQYLCACHKADSSVTVTPKHKWGNVQTPICTYCQKALFGTEFDLSSKLFDGLVGRKDMKWKAKVTFCPTDRYEMVIVENKVNEIKSASTEVHTLLSVRGFEYYTHDGTYVSFDLRTLHPSPKRKGPSGPPPTHPF